MPENFIPQAARTAAGPQPPDAEVRGPPDAGAGRNPAGPGRLAEEEHPQKSRLSLLQRLANVGLGRRDEETEPPIAARASGPAMSPLPPLPERKPQRSVAEQMGVNEPVSEYARRPAPQGLDAHGRPAAVARGATG